MNSPTHAPNNAGPSPKPGTQQAETTARPRVHLQPHAGHGPSRLYQASFWRLGLVATRILPPRLGRALAQAVAETYASLSPHRRTVVRQNLLPVLDLQTGPARRAARSLFRQFGLKLTDLWQFENGRPIEHLFHSFTGWDHFLAAHRQGRGALCLTLHLGNWEFGAPLLTHRGIQLQVITLPEPGETFSALRQAARARWGISTLTLSNDPFASVEIIRRLEANQAVALLMDRPPLQTAVAVELFGRQLTASVAAAELARATGCSLLPVYLPREPQGYAAHILPAIAYDRPSLRKPEERLELTRRILSVFEPAIRLYVDQWYHFVPIWLEETSPKPKA